MDRFQISLISLLHRCDQKSHTVLTRKDQWLRKQRYRDSSKAVRCSSMLCASVEEGPCSAVTRCCERQVDDRHGVAVVGAVPWAGLPSWKRLRPAVLETRFKNRGAQLQPPCQCRLGRGTRFIHHGFLNGHFQGNSLNFVTFFLK